ncbi:hypothetical protein D3C84_740110 [compost metagenome]
MGLGALPEKGPGGLGQDVGDETAGIGRLHGLAVIHQQAEARLGLELGAPLAGTPGMTQLAGLAAGHAAATGEKGTG